VSTKWFVKVPGLVAVTAADRIVLNAILMAPGVNIRPVAGGPLKLRSYDADALLQGPAPDRAAACEVLRSRAATLLPRPQPITLLRTNSGLRPIPLDGLPIVGALAGVEGVYAVVTHSAAHLAPLLGATPPRRSPARPARTSPRSGPSAWTRSHTGPSQWRTRASARRR
jgi:glycine/D-amino acid oxidase-like deaminating enzyme